MASKSKQYPFAHHRGLSAASRPDNGITVLRWMLQWLGRREPHKDRHVDKIRTSTLVSSTPKTVTPTIQNNHLEYYSILRARKYRWRFIHYERIGSEVMEFALLMVQILRVWLFLRCILLGVWSVGGSITPEIWLTETTPPSRTQPKTVIPTIRASRLGDFPELRDRKYRLRYIHYKSTWAGVS